ncbi:hypothetical protein RNJ44_04158 [Nakaseomyces bracarensis]|uniref:Metallo-beta-lactamase domain-containing protein n=1 Tax=Nakaseomyces bracarensis TaxID=273131 RepID=A0ABR4NU53_9SACH
MFKFPVRWIRVQGMKHLSSIDPKRRRRLGYGSIAALSILIPYTGYALFVTVSSYSEIDSRNELSDVVEKDKGINYQGTLIKYSPLQVLGRYENPFTEYRIQTIYEFFINRVVELFQRNRGGIPAQREHMRVLMPIHKPTWSGEESEAQSDLKDKEKTSDAEDHALKYNLLEEHADLHITPTNEKEIPVYNTWLGQSCNFVYYNGLKILTDPLFSDYLIHKEYGPKRITDMPAQIEQIPQPDIIMVSHNHPDHLDYESLQHWRNSDVLWIVPKGMKSFMEKNLIKNFIELSWWETCELRKDGQLYDISCTPAMHWSGRSVLDTNESLWCSFILRHNNKPILFHAGDTGYVNDLFIRIKERFGEGCKLALLPCGQYCPEWHQKSRHISPSEVIKIMKDMNVKNVLGVHWGTFVLSGEYFLEPKEKLEMLASFEGIRDKCYCPELGKTIKFD